jgi:tRNA-binding EMAP/Myf-like protein
MITFDEFKKVEIRAGKIISAEKIPNTDKLLKLIVDFAEVEEVKKVESVPVSDPAIKSESEVALKPFVESVDTNSLIASDAPVASAVQKITKLRQIVSGISLYFPDPAVLVGKTCMFVTNLEPRMIKGYESNGMLFAVSTKEGGFSLLEPNATIPPGTMAV